MADPTPVADGPTYPWGMSGIASGFHWSLGADRTIDWALSGGTAGETWSDAATWQTRIQTVLDTISRYIDVKFNFVGVFPAGGAASNGGSEITFVLDSAGAFATAAEWGDTQPLDSSAYYGAPGDIWLSSTGPALAQASYAPGSSGFAFLTHEVLQALGLRNLESQTAVMVAEGTTSLMAIERNYPDWSRVPFTVTGPSLADVMALQTLYGANTTTNAGDTTYSLSEVGHQTTIWDASGHDTLDLSGASYAWQVQLKVISPGNVVPAGGFAVSAEDLWRFTEKSIYWLVGDIEDVIGSRYGDFLWGSDSGNAMWGEGGNDTIRGGNGPNYLRGGDGNDELIGGNEFDDLHGNAGNDIEAGYGGDDWVVGGKGSDVLRGDAGSDVILGNIDNDTCFGGGDLDIIRGGQGDDVIYGDGDEVLYQGYHPETYGPSGRDFVSGDRGNDTIYGGGGADFFHTFQDAGIDRVMDFSIADGDRVMLDPGTTYTVSQVGADTVIDMGAGNQMILVGVQLSALPTGWIFEAWVVPW